MPERDGAIELHHAFLVIVLSVIEFVRFFYSKQFRTKPLT